MTVADDPRAMGLLSSVRWWAGWHPKTTVLAGGGLLGFLLANAIVTWWLRWLNTVGGAQSVVRAAIEPIVGFLLLGLLVGTGAWFLGVREVNRRFSGGPAAFVDRHRSPVDPAFVLVDAGAATGRGGTRPLLEAADRVSGVGLEFGSDAVTVRDVAVDVVGRRVELVGGERSIPYRRITGVEVDAVGVTVETDDGRSHHFPSATDPGEVVRALRSHVSERPR